MKRHSRAEHIYFSENTPVYLSAAVAQALGERADLYVKGNMLALASSPDGSLRVCAKPNSRAKFINARSLAQYLCAKFPKAGGMLPAQVDPFQEAVLFGPKLLGDEELDERFAPIDLSGLSGHRNYKVERDRITVSLALPRRVTAWVKEGTVALLKDPKGPYIREREERQTFLRSAALAAYLRRLWGGRSPHVRVVEEGVVLSTDYVFLTEMQGVEGFEPLALWEGGKTATLCRDHSIRLSQEAARALGSAASVYTCSGLLALRSDRRGDVDIERRDGNSVLLSARLYQQAALANPGVETFHLIPNGGLWVLSSKARADSIPPEDYFCRMLVGGGGEL